MEWNVLKVDLKLEEGFQKSLEEGMLKLLNDDDVVVLCFLISLNGNRP